MCTSLGHYFYFTQNLFLLHSLLLHIAEAISRYLLPIYNFHITASFHSVKVHIVKVALSAIRDSHNGNTLFLSLPFLPYLNSAEPPHVYNDSTTQQDESSIAFTVTSMLRWNSFSAD